MTSDVESAETEPQAPAARTGAPARREDRRSRSASSAIYRALREDILGMRRRPGEPIVEKQIARAYGVSRTPVREAMLRLADEELVDIYPQSGTFVARIPVDELPEALEIRAALEERMVAFAAERASTAQIEELRACVERQRRAVEALDQDTFHREDETLHRLTADASGFPRFWSIIEQVKLQVDRYRRLTLPEPGRMAAVLCEHERIVEAIGARDSAGAIRATRAHMASLRAGLDSAREVSPYYFTTHVHGDEPKD